ncbi:uncharacterized protein BXZ73DRAFT_108250 [Epithele typhae]|uniref:uncharacterized protein n=1 Tax=Epithele typhae TaxID=378194 RepID=UPI002007FD64|nr:uncharacterized protein BXZ73DRAFT_108250 [Epithele typhae]KAH9911090.1 hypothetical protein BXZ73DRAFT_108250 [Epithele typhae]
MMLVAARDTTTLLDADRRQNVPAPLSTSVHTSTIAHEGGEDDHERDDVPDPDSDPDFNSADDVKSDASHDEEDSKNPVRLLSNSQSTLGSLSTDNAFTVALVGAFLRHLPNLEYSFKRRIVEDLADTDRFESCRKLNIIDALFLLAPSCPIRTLYIKGPTFIVKAMYSVICCTKPGGLVAAIGSLPALRVLVVGVLCYLVADPPCAAEAFMRGLDLDALARRLCVACPTLRTADRMGNPGHRGTEAVGEGHSAEPRDVEREAGEVSSDGAM